MATKSNVEVTRQEVEDFLYQEAWLLDNWQLDEWAELFTEDTRYIVPTTDLPDGDPKKDLVFIDDDLTRLKGRVERLKSRRAHREYPSSRTRRYISNVRIAKVEGEDVHMTAYYLVYRIRMGQIGPYVGHYQYILKRENGSFKIRYRRAELDLESLMYHGAVSIVL